MALSTPDGREDHPEVLSEHVCALTAGTEPKVQAVRQLLVSRAFFDLFFSSRFPSQTGLDERVK